MRESAIVGALLLVLFAMPASAYVGPGLGAGTVAVVLGVIASVFLALVGILWYPFKRLFKRFRRNGSAPKQDAGDD
jgi:O-antigen/teichoic acid export membrane protein